jgi:hypothetical protein
MQTFEVRLQLFEDDSTSFEHLSLRGLLPSLLLCSPVPSSPGSKHFDEDCDSRK